jgi:excisionase family DNA binding protein
VDDQAREHAGPPEGFASALNRRVVELRRQYPQIHGVDLDCLFVAYLVETSRFGLFRFGPVAIDVDLVEEIYLRGLGPGISRGPHRASSAYHAFYERLGKEIERAGTRRPNELHYLLAFMRSPDGLPARVFGELGIAPEAVEDFARRPREPRNAGSAAGTAFLSPREVAARLGVNEQTVRAWIRSGKLPASRLAGRKVLRIRESDIETVLEPVDPASLR